MIEIMIIIHEHAQLLKPGFIAICFISGTLITTHQIVHILKTGE